MNYEKRDAAKRLNRWAKRYIAMVKDPYCEESDQSVAEYAYNVGLRPDVLMRAVRKMGAEHG